MSAIQDLEDLIHVEVIKSESKLREIGLYQLTKNIADSLVFSFETSIEFNNKKGIFGDFNLNVAELLKSLEYVTIESPIKQWQKDTYICEFNDKARIMYERLKQEVYSKTSSIAIMKEYNPESKTSQNEI